MKISDEEFKALQRHWYKLLEDSGFQDIEHFKNGHLVLKETIRDRLKHISFLKMKVQEEYYHLMTYKVLDESTKFKSETDKYILTRYIDGVHINQIIEELMAKGLSKNRDTIRFMIRRYELEWGINHYDNKELHRKG